ncbi:AraC family transcriptional regulator [Paenibacillus sp.]|uniref:AraC family transcriptional regulator n=1 Tax=Paenibacillus sp. TaxID=58172 RepID=UPI002D6F12F7|nr:AraC family transcriptional regulator [Paenibacillus sp.]HZG55736.1 AraC family transcriptional regulator [Paenibacillus sp.]
MAYVDFLQFKAPPLPHYIVGGERTYPIGKTHPAVANLGIFKMLVVVRGKVSLAEDEKEFRVTKGHAFIVRPDKSYAPLEPAKRETQYFWVHFQTTGEWSAVTEEEAGPGGARLYPYDEVIPRQELTRKRVQHFTLVVPQFCKLTLPTKTYRNIKRLIDLNRHHKPSLMWQQQTIFQEVLHDLHGEQQYRAASSSIALAEKTAQLLRERYREPLHYREIGESLNFHPTYVARCMQQVFGVTPLEYLKQYRVEQAKLLLVNTDAPVSRIAEDVGFSHMSYFTQCFAKTEGVTPSEYRKSHRL